MLLVDFFVSLERNRSQFVDTGVDRTKDLFIGIVLVVIMPTLCGSLHSSSDVLLHYS